MSGLSSLIILGGLVAIVGLLLLIFRHTLTTLVSVGVGFVRGRGLHHGQQDDDKRMDKQALRKAIKYIVGSPYKESIVMALSKDSEGLSAGELQARSGAASNGSFYWHIHELEWLGVVQHNSSYKLTETGKEIVKALAKFL